MKSRIPKNILYTICILVGLAGIAGLIGPRRVTNAKSTSLTLDYPAQVLNIPSNAPSGELAYLLRVKILPTSTSTKQLPLDLIFRMTGNGTDQSKPASANRISSDLYYPYSVTFSPTGTYLLIETTYPTAWLDNYRVAFWNLKTKTLKQGPKMNYYPATGWSPDSRFLAYFEGGDANGDESRGTDPLRLYVYSLNSNKSQLIVQNSEAKSFAWTVRDTILYAFESQDSGDTASTYNLKRPSIFETALSPVAPVEIIQNGFAPVPSPDGKWIAFQGWPDPAQEAEAKKAADRKGEGYQSPFGLYLFNRVTKKRMLLHMLPLYAGYENLLWSPDSSRLFSVRNIYRSTHPPFFSSNDQKNYPGYGKGYVSIIEIPTLVQREVTAINAIDTVSRINPAPQFAIQGLSRDGKSLFVRVNEQHDGYQYGSFRAVDLGNGTSKTIFDGQDVSGIDWHEEPAHLLSGVTSNMAQ